MTEKTYPPLPDPHDYYCEWDLNEIQHPPLNAYTVRDGQKINAAVAAMFGDSNANQT